MKKHALVPLIIFFFCCSCHNAGTKGEHKEMQSNGLGKFQKIANNIIYFSHKKINVELYDLKYIGQLNTQNSLPFLIVSGKTCDECDENNSIFVFSSADSVISVNKMAKYIYPGKIRDYADSNNLLFESRMFYGNCFAGKPDCIIWIQKQYHDGKEKRGVFIAKVVSDTLNDTYVDGDSIAFKNETSCNELVGIDVSSEP